MDLKFFLSLLSSSAYVIWPLDLAGWLAWLVLLGLVLYLGLRWRDLQRPQSGRIWLATAGLFILAVPASLFVGVQLPPGPALSPAGLTIAPAVPSLMVLAAIPLVLAAGFLGPWQAAAIGALTGVFLSIWDTHSPYTPLQYALLATVWSALMRQRYRTFLFSALRHPLLASAAISLLAVVLLFAAAIFQTLGEFPVRLDFAVSQLRGASLSLGGQLIFAGLIAEAVRYGWPQAWGGQPPFESSPAETSLGTRVQYSLGVLIIALVLGLMIGDWIVAGDAARQMLRQRLSDTATMGAESIPFFLEAGQNLILQIAADPNLSQVTDDELSELLAEHLRSAPYFRQLFVLDATGAPLEGYPIRDFASLFPTQEEAIGFDLARQGVAFQYYTVPPVDVEGAAQISFIAEIRDEEGDLYGVLWGRTDLASNPFTRPVLNNLASLSSIGGQGMLLDEENRILYHPLSSLIMTPYTGKLADEATFFDDTAPDGTRNLVFYQPVLGRSWSVVLSVSAQQAQQLALRIASPLLGLLILLSLAVFIVMRIGLRAYTGSLKGLAQEANRIAEGDLDHPLEVKGVDEVGQLRRSFEEMRLRLRDRIEELGQLLLVSQGVASSLQIDQAVRSVLDAAIQRGASAAYILLSDEGKADFDQDSPAVFQAGPSADKYSHAGEALLKLASRQPKIQIANPARVRSLDPESGQPLPGAIFAAALRHESTLYGVFWVAHDEPYRFTEEEQDFLITLAGQAALGAANSRSYLNAAAGRRRLEAILNATPDPVLVTDSQNRLLLANPAAWQALGEGKQLSLGRRVEQAVTNPELLALLTHEGPEPRSQEFQLADGHHYFATASTVVAEGKRVGRVCVLHDITEYKQLDQLKTEFVDSVSHDLRSPLTLMRGYASMMPMVGELNEQQQGYMKKIQSGVDNMVRLVTNLLDLGRIEAGIGLQLGKTPIIEVIEEVTGTFQVQAVQEKIDLSRDIPPHITSVIMADQALLEQAISNLIENAIKYTDPGGKVIVRLSERNANIIIEVEDTGIGIAPVDISRLFERFYRAARREARRQRGSGLGLAIVKSIAVRHGGRVWVESRLGKGSRFFLEIPIEPPQSD